MWLQPQVSIQLKSHLYDEQSIFEGFVVEVVEEKSDWRIKLESKISGALEMKDCYDDGMQSFTVCVRDWQQAEQMAQQAFNVASDPAIRAEACLIIGKVRHSQAEFHSAQTYYHKAREGMPLSPLVLYRCAQIHAQCGESSVQDRVLRVNMAHCFAGALASAMECAEIAHSLAPESPEVDFLSLRFTNDSFNVGDGIAGITSDGDEF